MVPINTIIDPKMMLNPNKNGAKSAALAKRFKAIIGAIAPKNRPPLYAKPLALLRISVGNRSERNAGMAPKPVVATNTIAMA